MYDFDLTSYSVKSIHKKHFQELLKMYAFHLTNLAFFLDFLNYERTGFRDLGSLEPTRDSNRADEKGTVPSRTKRTLTGKRAEDGESEKPETKKSRSTEKRKKQPREELREKNREKRKSERQKKDNGKERIPKKQ